MTAGSTRTAGLIATLFASLVSFQAACNSGTPEIASAPSVCNLGDQQTKLADVVTTMAFNPLVLAELGVTVQTEGATRAAPQHTLSILPGPASSFDGASECMAVDVVDGHLRDFVSGRISHTGGPTLAHGQSAVSLVGFELRVGAEPRTFEVVSSTGEPLLLGTLPHYQIDATGVLDVFNVDLAATPSLAIRLGAPHLAGTILGTLTLRARVMSPTAGVASAALEGTDPTVQNACDDFTGKVDVALIAMGAVQQQGRVGDQVVITPSATLKNVGTANVPWQARFSGVFPPYNTDQHPFLVWGLFRESGGFFEPIAYSDVKHAFLTINANCAPGSCRIGSVLGLGCEDVYGVGTNGAHLGPRSEIKPHAGTWAHCDFPEPNTPSHFDQVAPFCSADNNNGTGENTLTHRSTARDSELSVVGAKYYFVAWYVVRDDANIFNSMGWRRIAPFRNGNTWTFLLSTSFKQGSVLDAFVDPTLPPSANRSNSTFQDPAAGATQVAATATALGDGRFRYVYSLMNHDFDPKVGAFSLPIGAGVTLTDLRFSDGDEDPTNDWTLAIAGNQATWTPPTPAANLDWGTSLTVSFVANQAPSSSFALVTRADTGASSAIKAIAPGSLALPGLGRPAE